MRLLLSLVMVSMLPAAAQQAPAPAAAPAQASVEFGFDWSQGVPWQKYTIDVAADGKAHFEGTPHPDETNDTDVFQQDFTVSDANRLKVFTLAQKLHYFRGDFDSHLKHIAQTGTKTLQYRSPEINSSTSFNWSKDPDIEELTHYFQGIATTIDLGRALAFQYRFDKLGMDQRMKELEDLEASHSVEELAIIAPILQKIADDPNLMNISRESAQRLLRTISPTQAATQNPASR
jgi:hypothetical protein